MSLDDKAFANTLKEFCHFYQIPFIENNIPKTTYDAANIYYKLEEDGIKIPDRFTWLAGHLASIPKEDVEDTETTFRMRDKWMKFFKTGLQRMEIDQSLALKNTYNSVLEAYIRDTYTEFTDENIVRAYDVIEGYDKHDTFQLLELILKNIITRINYSSFDLETPELLFSLCKALRRQYPHLALTNDQHCLNTVSKGGNYSLVLESIFPYIKVNFESYSVREQAIILTMYKKLDILDAELFEIFYNSFKSSYVGRTTKDELVKLVDPFSGKTENLMLEIVNLLDYGFIKFPHLKTSTELDDSLKALISDYLKYLSKTNLLAFPELQSEQANIKLEGILSNDFMRFQYNNDLLNILKDSAEAMELGVIKNVPSNLVLALKGINPNECNKKSYLLLLKQITNMTVKDFNGLFTELFIKDCGYSLLNLHKLKSKYYITDRLVEIRDAIVDLMDMHHNTSNVNLLNSKYEGDNLYQSIENPELVDAYLEMISSIFAIDEVRKKKNHNAFNAYAALNDYKIYKFLYDPVVMKHILDGSQIEGGKTSRFHDSPKGWNSDYCKYIFTEIDRRFHEEHLISLRNNIFMSITNLYNNFDLNMEEKKAAKIKQAFEKEIAAMEDNFEDLLAEDIDSSETEAETKTLSNVLKEVEEEVTLF